MTEAEWLACSSPFQMMRALPCPVSERRLRLFGCACLRRAWRLLETDCHEAIFAAEHYAAGRITKQQLAWAACGAQCVFLDQLLRTGCEIGHVARFAQAAEYVTQWMDIHTAMDVADRVLEHLHLFPDDRSFVRRWLFPKPALPESDLAIMREAEVVVQATLFRCIVGNPFRSASLNPRCRTGDVVRLAEEIDGCDEQVATLDCQLLGILADALEDASCSEAAILSHLRSPGPHVRGCWVLDLILGKE